MEPMQKFYMLKVENGGTPSAVHSTPESARGRAIALARGAKSRVAILGLEFVVTPELPETADILVRVERVEEQTTDPRFCTGLDERKPQT